MKALSLWQPWASLIVIGAKRFETRSWSTAYRGQLLIHAAKHFTREEAETCHDDPFNKVLDNAGYHTCNDIPRGCLLGVADLIQCYLCTDYWLEYLNYTPFKPKYELSKLELSFGDFYPGRFAWQLANIRRFPTPIPYTGHQGLFNVPDDVVAEQLAQAISVDSVPSVVKAGAA